jgi:signal transduction histidine kinase
MNPSRHFLAAIVGWNPTCPVPRDTTQNGGADRAKRTGKRSDRLVAAGALGLVGLVGLVDYATGLEVSVTLLYLVPVGLCAWHLGRRTAVFMACASAGAWLAADVVARPAVDHSLVPLWNAATLAATLAVVAHLLAKLQRSNEALETTVLERTATLRNEVAERVRTEARLTRAHAELQASLAELQSTQLQLIEAAKSESIGRLAAGVAHEVKNPLMTLGLGADYFLNRGACRPEETALLHDMKEAVRRAGSIINLLLDFSRPRPVQFKDEDLNALVETALSLARQPLAAHRVSVVRELQENLPPVPLDRNRIEHVLVNLVDNAIQAMPEGGTLTVRTRVDTGAGAGSAQPGTVSVMVEDTGRGIPEEVLNKVFEPFFTTKPQGQGTGLGLSIVRKIMQIHGGSVALANRPEGGAVALLDFNLQPKGTL